MSRGASSAAPVAAWTRIAEVGTNAGLRIGLRISQSLYRPAMLWLLWLPAAYFYWRSRAARAASLQYLERVGGEGRSIDGRPIGAALVIRHMHDFGVSLYDRVELWGGKRLMTIERANAELFERVGASGRGALIVSAHIGSPDMLWLLSRELDLVVNVVAFFANAERFNSVLESLDTGPSLRVIELDPASAHAALQVRACIERGEWVVMLVDRTPPGETTRAAELPFLGAPARFGLGPFLLAATLGCPVLMMACPRIAETHYLGHLTELSAGVRAARGEREQVARRMLEQYVAELEKLCACHPLQWFNFYPFWSEPKP